MSVPAHTIEYVFVYGQRVMRIKKGRGRQKVVRVHASVCVRVWEAREMRCSGGGLSDALELPFFFPDKDSICHRAICCLPSRRSIRHAAFTLMSPLHSSRLAADAVHTKGRTHNPRPGKGDGTFPRHTCASVLSASQIQYTVRAWDFSFTRKIKWSIQRRL